MAAMALGFAATANAATDKQAILIAEPSIDALNAQEKAAAEFFVDKHDGIVITPSTLDLLESENLEVVWIHIDRIGIQLGSANLPAPFNQEATLNALKAFVADGGNLLLTKHATQLAVALGRIDIEVSESSFGSGDGGDGTDTWTIQNVYGVACDEQLDRSNHAIFKDLVTINDFGTPTVAMLGTGDEGAMWREDHNCFWIPADLGFGEGNGNNKCILDFEAKYNCLCLGTWGHVGDFCGAGIVEFLPQTAARSTEGGTILANGLAACEWAPRNGGNAYHSNLERLTSNSLNYLTTESGTSGIADVEAAESSAAEYFTLQGVRVAEPTAAGIYIKRQGNKATKVIIK